MTASGKLEPFVADDGVRGMTSNLKIFDEAHSGSKNLTMLLANLP
jgi:hypothetical protein